MQRMAGWAGCTFSMRARGVEEFPLLRARSNAMRDEVGYDWESIGMGMVCCCTDVLRTFVMRICFSDMSEPASRDAIMKRGLPRPEARPDESKFATPCSSMAVCMSGDASHMRQKGCEVESSGDGDGDGEGDIGEYIGGD